MGFLLRTIIGVVGITVVGGFIVNQIPSLRQSAVEFINPAAKESRLISDLDKNLSQLEAHLTPSTPSQNQDIGGEVLETKDLLAHSRSIISDLQESNKNNSGLVKSAVNAVTKVLFNSTPQPTSDPASQSQNSPTPQPCPTK